MLNAVRNPACIATSGLASFAFARHYSQNLVWFLFLALLRCFSSGGSPHIPILFSIWYIHSHVYGFLHSDICGSLCAYHSPQLFAVNHVLLRLPMPRHSPYALISLTILRIMFSFLSFALIVVKITRLLNLSIYCRSFFLICILLLLFFIQFSSCSFSSPPFVWCFTACSRRELL